MEKRAFVTLAYNGEEHDFDLPLQTPIKELEEKLAILIPNVFKSLSLEDEVFFFESDAGYLSPDLSLGEQGVSDGTRLQIRILTD